MRATTRAIRERQSLLEKGVMAWGGVIIVLVVLLLVFIALAAAGIVRDNTVLYRTVKDFETLIGAVVGFSGLAWSHFFAATHAGVHADPPHSSEGGKPE